MNRIVKAYHLIATLGPRWVWFRVRYAVKRRSGGLVRRSPAATWAACLPRQATAQPRWFMPLENVGGEAVWAADEVLRGEYRLFSWHRAVAGMPPIWSRNPLTGQAAPPERHWAALGDFAFGDIKGIWELSRFPWAFALGRAFSATRDERYAEGFWRLFEDWLQHDPPNLGPNWMCGQEASFRLFAVIWTTDVLSEAAASSADRKQKVAAFVDATAARIAANLEYALSQSNNHGVSECVGLITAALRRPSHPQSASWAKTGWSALERQLGELVYPDGGFSQHSVVYHRVLLHDLLWLVAVLQRAHALVPPWLISAAQRALAFLEAMMTPATGRVPLYGPNDGANILPLADADFLDFRPVVQAGHALLHQQRRLPPGPWDEAARWLAEMPEKHTGRVEQEETKETEDGRTGGGRRTEGVGAYHFPDAGALVWRRGATRVFVRCPTRFRHRPAQADLLHVDVEWRGVPIAHDAGTYSYNATGAFSGGLKEAAVHNSVTFDGVEPLQKISRFLYLPWPKGRALWQGETFVATHDGWKRIGITHERRLRWGSSDHLVVTDRMRGRGSHRARVHWLVADLPHKLRPEACELVVQTPHGEYSLKWCGPSPVVSLVRADPSSARGWWAPYYGYAAPALSLTIEFDFAGEVEFITEFQPDYARRTLPPTVPG